MLDKIKTKFVILAVMIAVITGMATGGAIWMCENGTCICRKAKKAFKKMTAEL